ncbi:hypothetical protein Ae201684P_016922 [Aphanomyces euteiches]|nr:hypothetical protein Ae201684P_016922 [Aphanomyces euteiches]
MDTSAERTAAEESMMQHLGVIRDELQCYICHRTLQDPHCLACNHNFCKPCIDSQLCKAVSECPKCGIPMCPSDVHRNQFLDGLLNEWKLVEAALAKTEKPTGTPAKRKLPVDFESPSSSTQDAMTSLLSTPQLNSYKNRLERQAQLLDDSVASTPSPPSLKTATLLPPSSQKQTSSIPSPPCAASSQETSMSVPTPPKVPSPPKSDTKVVLVPQSPPRREPQPITGQAPLVPATQNAEDDDDEIPETELPVYRHDYNDYDEDEETQAPHLHFSPSSPSPPHVLRIAATNLTKEQNQLLLYCVRSLGGRFGQTFRTSRDPITRLPMPPVSHLITTSDSEKRCQRTQKYMEGLAAQAWIVDMQWVVESFKAKRWLAEDEFEILGDASALESADGTPRRCRTSPKGTTQIFKRFCFKQMHDCMEQATSVQIVVEACGGVWKKHGENGDPRGRTVVGIVSKSLSKSKCRALAVRHHPMLIIRANWIFDSISHMQPYDKYIP